MEKALVLMDGFSWNLTFEEFFVYMKKKFNYIIVKICHEKLALRMIYDSKPLNPSYSKQSFRQN
jgi:hypothetical protein